MTPTLWNEDTWCIFSLLVRHIDKGAVLTSIISSTIETDLLDALKRFSTFRNITLCYPAISDTEMDQLITYSNQRSLSEYAKLVNSRASSENLTISDDGNTIIHEDPMWGIKVTITMIGYDAVSITTETNPTSPAEYLNPDCTTDAAIGWLLELDKSHFLTDTCIHQVQRYHTQFISDQTVVRVVALLATMGLSDTQIRMCSKLPNLDMTKVWNTINDRRNPEYVTGDTTLQIGWSIRHPGPENGVSKEAISARSLVIESTCSGRTGLDIRKAP